MTEQPTIDLTPYAEFLASKIGREILGPDIKVYQNGYTRDMHAQVEFSDPYREPIVCFLVACPAWLAKSIAFGCLRWHEAQEPPNVFHAAAIIAAKSHKFDPLAIIAEAARVAGECGA